MAPIDEMTDEQFEQHALAILQKELGLAGLARFLRVHRSGNFDYTAERHRWLDSVSAAELSAEFGN